MRMNKTVRRIRIAVFALAFLLFCLWLFRRVTPLSLGTPFAALSLGLYAFVVIAVLTRLVEGKLETEGPAASADTGRERRCAWGVLLLFGIAVTLLEYAAVYWICHPANSFFNSFSQLYYRSDVAHYMGIARDWYVQTGDERLRLVFLPLYPLVTRALTWNGDYFSGAFAAAQLFSFACLPAAYELFRLDMDRYRAMACARILFLLPGAAFLRVPMSEGLFLFLTLLAVYHSRRRQFLRACLFTALSALTRSLGILLLALVGMEMISAFFAVYKRDRADALRRVPGYVGCLALGCCGTLTYLMINWQVTGTPFTFLTYQRDNWTQQLGLFFNTAAYQAEYALAYGQLGAWTSILSLSLPNLLCAFGALGLLYAARERMRISYLLWSLLYFAAAIGATWLLSGPRYLAMLFPLSIPLHGLCKTRYREHILEGTLLIWQTAYLLMLALDMSVY